MHLPVELRAITQGWRDCCLYRGVEEILGGVVHTQSDEP
jgi:hypothetical protein